MNSGTAKIFELLGILELNYPIIRTNIIVQVVINRVLAGSMRPLTRINVLRRIIRKRGTYGGPVQGDIEHHRQTRLTVVSILLTSIRIIA